MRGLQARGSPVLFLEVIKTLELAINRSLAFGVIKSSKSNRELIGEKGEKFP
jgi:hypothetical protein